mmetsp:Transcript_5989/g.25047  ORF Transcript_5989/g.25047 Transcript_5989/m.25047 type:complete len:593 (+) Transcript_5989:65-1843(+)
MPRRGRPLWCGVSAAQHVVVAIQALSVATSVPGGPSAAAAAGTTALQRSPSQPVATRPADDPTTTTTTQEEKETLEYPTRRVAAWIDAHKHRVARRVDSTRKRARRGDVTAIEALHCACRQVRDRSMRPCDQCAALWHRTCARAVDPRLPLPTAPRRLTRYGPVRASQFLCPACFGAETASTLVTLADLCCGSLCFTVAWTEAALRGRAQPARLVFACEIEPEYRRFGEKLLASTTAAHYDGRLTSFRRSPSTRWTAAPADVTIQGDLMRIEPVMHANVASVPFFCEDGSGNLHRHDRIPKDSSHARLIAYGRRLEKNFEAKLHDIEIHESNGASLDGIVYAGVARAAENAGYDAFRLSLCPSADLARPYNPRRRGFVVYWLRERVGAPTVALRDAVDRAMARVRREAPRTPPSLLTDDALRAAGIDVSTLRPDGQSAAVRAKIEGIRNAHAPAALRGKIVDVMHSAAWARPTTKSDSNTFTRRHAERSMFSFDANRFLLPREHAQRVGFTPAQIDIALDVFGPQNERTLGELAGQAVARSAMDVVVFAVNEAFSAFLSSPQKRAQSARMFKADQARRLARGLSLRDIIVAV